MTLEKRARPESLDYFLAAIAPVFIIGMIGSLVYFIITVCYEGPFTVRLMWILGLYTVAAVLIARIAIEQSRQLAFTYMFALGGATLVVAPQFLTVSGPMAIFSFPILIGLLVLVAVLADRITFDCTSMNEHVQSSGVGLLQSLGLVQSERKQPAPIANKVESSEESLTDKQRKKATARRKHNPGVWVLYFALVALPLFGLGQLFIQNPVDRRWAFTYLFFYLLSSLFLLVLISLLSLRKYLRERGVPMEQSFAVRWLTIGMTSVFAVLFLLSLLPTPSLSLVSMDLPFRFTSPDDLEASKWGWGNEGVQGDGGAQGDGAQNKPKAANGDQPQVPQDPAGAKPQPENNRKPLNNEPDDQKVGKGQSEGGSKEGGNQNGKGQSDQGKASDEQKGNSQGKSDDSNKQQGESRDERNQKPDASAEKNSQQKQPGDVDPAKGEKAAQNEPDAGKQPKGDPAPKQKDQQEQQNQQQQQPKPQQPSMSIQWNFTAAFQWLLMLILAIVAVVFGIKYRRELLQSIQSFRDWLSALFGRKKKSLQLDGQVAEGEMTIADPYPPFASFANPFAAGSGWSREQIVRHMYRAIMSWGYEQRVVMRDDETPEEFIRRLARRFPEQQEQLGLLGVFYNRIAYARGTIASKEIAPMAELWRWLSDRPAK